MPPTCGRLPPRASLGGNAASLLQMAHEMARDGLQSDFCRHASAAVPPPRPPVPVALAPLSGPPPGYDCASFQLGALAIVLITSAALVLSLGGIVKAILSRAAMQLGTGVVCGIGLTFTFNFIVWGCRVSRRIL